MAARALSAARAPLPPPRLIVRVPRRAQAVATGLIIASVGGLTFIGYGSWEIYDRAQQRKRLKQEFDAKAAE